VLGQDSVASPTAAPRAPRVGLWGTFDVDNYGDLVLAHITRQELLRRVPDADVRTYAPLGWFHPVGFEGVEPSEPLGMWTSSRAARLARALDCVVIGGGDILHTEVSVLAHAYGIEPEEMARCDPSGFFIEGLGPEWDPQRAVVWSAVGVPRDFTPDEAARVRCAARFRRYLSVRDEPSRRRLEAAGVEREVAVVPDPAVLLPRVYDRPVLDRALEDARLLDWFPSGGRVLAVQGNGHLVPWARALADAIKGRVAEGGWSVVTIEIGPCHGDGEFAHALHAALRGAVPLYHVPGTACLEQVAAAVAAATAFVGSSLHGVITAFAFGRPVAILQNHGMSKIDGFAALAGSLDWVVRRPEDLGAVLALLDGGGRPSPSPARLQAAVDRHFDRIAEIVVDAAAETGARRSGRGFVDNGRLMAVLSRAQRERERRLGRERAAAAARVADLERALRGRRRRRQ
jgi:polysaccharide pyruvyl transferase WcaK-like protein